MRSFHANLVVIVAGLLLAIALQTSLPRAAAGDSAPAPASLAALPYQLGPFCGREAHGPEVKGFPGELHRIYQMQNSPIEVLAFPAPLSEHSPEDCLPYLGWSIIARRRQALQANPAIELQIVVAVSANPSDSPRACGFYWRRKNAATANLLVSWLQQRWATVTQSLQNAELVTVCTPVEDIRHPQPAIERVYRFTNALEPYFHASPAMESRARPPRRR